jgi:lysylphosphatidylglycerol synthetase-like protein (DUF2156 family)
LQALVATTDMDPLAPFVLRDPKCHFLSAGGRAVLAYQVCVRTAVVSGDPIGDATAFPSLVSEFISFARSRRWIVAVLAASEGARPLWRAHGLRPVTISRDVVIGVDGYHLDGRKFRNLRQAVQRTHNAAVSVTFHREGLVDRFLSDQLRQLQERSRKRTDRGFSMALGNPFDGAASDALIAVAHDSAEQPVAYHRYLRSGARGLTLDVQVRATNAPNGVEERLINDVIQWARQRDLQWISLAFAPFADLYQTQHPAVNQRLARAALHLLDPWLRLSSLHRFQSKFHALNRPRYVMLKRRWLVPAAIAMLRLEFQPHRAASNVSAE